MKTLVRAAGTSLLLGFTSLIACSDDAASEGEETAGTCSGLEGFAYVDASQCFQAKAALPASVCVRGSDPPSSGLYPACLVSPEGELYHLLLRGDWVVQGDGWSHSAYSLVSSNLSEEDTARCSQAAQVSPASFADGGEALCE